MWIFDRGSKKGKKKAPRNILAETEFYTFSGKDGTKNYSLKKASHKSKVTMPRCSNRKSVNTCH